MDTLARAESASVPSRDGIWAVFGFCSKQDEIFWLLGVQYRPHKSDGGQTRDIISCAERSFLDLYIHELENIYPLQCFQLL